MNKHMKKIYDVGLVTVSGNNYGNNITNLALFTYIKELGYNVKEINMSIAPQLNPAYYNWGLFLQNPYENDELENVDNRWKLNELNKGIKMFVLGSDQLWRFDMFVKHTEYFTCLDWVDMDKYKASYATSFGIEEYEGNAATFKKYINRFQKVSVRETTGIDILRKYTSIPVEVVMDPVFLLSDSYYKRLMQKSNFEKKDEYVGAYILDQKSWKRGIIDLVARDALIEEKVLVTDPIDGNVLFQNPDSTPKGVEDWLKIINGCDVFITDSFHGMCMALILKKNFWVLIDEEAKRGKNRICDLLDGLDLKDRIITEKSEVLPYTGEKINYNRVYMYLENKIEESKKWLIETLHEGKTYSEKKGIEDFARLCVYKKNYILNQVKNYRQRKQYREYIKKLGCDSHKIKTVAWGAGKCFFYNIIEIRNIIKITEVCDKDRTKWNEEIVKGIKCISPDEVTWSKDTIVIIMIYSVDNVLKIREELTKYGVKSISIDELYTIIK